MGRRGNVNAREVGRSHRTYELRSITQGRGRFSWKLDHYAEVPTTIADKVIAEHQARVAAGEKH